MDATIASAFIITPCDCVKSPCSLHCACIVNDYLPANASDKSCRILDAPPGLALTLPPSSRPSILSSQTPATAFVVLRSLLFFCPQSHADELALISTGSSPREFVRLHFSTGAILRGLSLIAFFPFPLHLPALFLLLILLRRLPRSSTLWRLPRMNPPPPPRWGFGLRSLCLCNPLF